MQPFNTIHVFIECSGDGESSHVPIRHYPPMPAANTTINEYIRMVVDFSYKTENLHGMMQGASTFQSALRLHKMKLLTTIFDAIFEKRNKSRH